MKSYKGIKNRSQQEKGDELESCFSKRNWSSNLVDHKNQLRLHVVLDFIQSVCQQINQEKKLSPDQARALWDILNFLEQQVQRKLLSD